jgi:predicted Zn-ribbon and HTH transcriptional regulator
MQSDPSAEWQRLTLLYGEMSDEELENLAASFGDLTEFAQPILRDEMRKRGLVDPVAAGGFEERTSVFGAWARDADESSRGEDEEASNESDGEEPNPAHEYTWKTQLCECDDRERAWQISEVLRRAGIESWTDAPRRGLDMRSVQVLVAADQLEEAKQILLQPIPQDIVDQSKVKVEDFVPPSCPKCGAEDPLLESVEPTNTWRCENCGAQWTDSAAFDAAPPAGY